MPFPDCSRRNSAAIAATAPLRAAVNLHLLQGRAHGRLAGRAGYRVKVAPHGLGHQIIALVAGVGPVLAKIGDGNQDQAGVGLRQPFIAQSQFRQFPRWKALNDNIRSSSQSLEKLSTVRLLNVQRDAPLVVLKARKEVPRSGSGTSSIKGGSWRA